MSFNFDNWFPNLFLGSWDPDTISGTERRDIIITFGSNDSIRAGGGDDIILSGDGNDTISAGSGNDIVDAGKGDDVIETGGGSDIVNGGRGFDTVVYAGAISDYSINLPGRLGTTTTVRDLANGDTDRLSSVEALHFGADDYTLYLDGRNNSVLARDDAAATQENTPLALVDLTANDSEFDGDTITVTGVSANSAGGAAVTLVDGVIHYDQGSIFDSLKPGETATDTFTYTVDDGRGGVHTATVTVTINGVNDAPVFTSSSTASFEENTDGVVLTVEANDADSDQVVYSIAGGADAALFTIDQETGELRFINTPDFENPGRPGRRQRL